MDTTVKELEENLKQVIITTAGSSKTNLRHAKVTGITCDVSKPEDVQKLANFAVSELGSIDIWVNNMLFIFLITKNLSHLLARSWLYPLFANFEVLY